MANLEGNRWHTKDNEIIATYFGWVAIIKPIFVGNGLLLRWSLILSEGTGGESLPIIYYKTLEEAIENVNKLMEYKTFKDLKSHIC
ncbi:MAG: hypothetical protein IKK93_11700 [Campylobacter sp.]|nr:hypothetical protein [Campylobacter sp.]